MTHPHAASDPQPDPTIRMSDGWHCLHLFYRVDQSILSGIDQADRERGREELLAALDPATAAPERLQVSIVSGHKADLGLMLLDPDPLVLDAVQQAVRGTGLGPALDLSWSFVSITEVSEYVPTIEQYAERLKQEGAGPDDPAYTAKMSAYEARLPAMNQQRLYPDFPELPVTSFYPMTKIRHPQANWYMTPVGERSRLMAEHATSGIKFAGRVTQLITASTGFDDWEWGVTLWGRAPEHIKEIVYTMRFDEASARFAEFGPFYLSYVRTAPEAIDHLGL